MSTPYARRAAALALSLTLACGGDEPDSDSVRSRESRDTATPHIAAQEQVSSPCTTRFPKTPIGGYPNSRPQCVVVDIDGDANPDTIRVFWAQTHHDFPLPHITIRSATIHVTYESYSDPPAPTVIDAKDMNEDGIADLLVAAADESSVWAGLILVYNDTLQYAAVAGPELSYMWDVIAGDDACEPELMPRFEDGPERGIILSVASGWSHEVPDCHNPPRTRFRMEGDSLIRITR